MAVCSLPVVTSVTAWGCRLAAIYDAFANSWTRLPNMNAGRWYPTATTLPNGDVLVLSGDIDTTVGRNNLPQVWEVATGRWRDLWSAQPWTALYPFMHVAPNGQLIMTGADAITRYLDPSGTGSLRFVADSNFGFRDYGTSVLYDDGKILLVGGDDPPTATAEVIDLNAPTPAWTYVSPMAVARRQLNATILPDGKVLITGGSSGQGFDNGPLLSLRRALGSRDPPVQLARQRDAIPRISLDGRPVAGWTRYPVHWRRPLAERGGVFASLPLQRCASDHHLRTGERRLRADVLRGHSRRGFGRQGDLDSADVHDAFLQHGPADRSTDLHGHDGWLERRGSRGSNLSPPGYYMLFVLNGTGVPSIAKMIRIGVPASAPPAAPTNLTAVAISNSQINLTWTDNATTENGFQIERSLDGTTFTPTATVAANVTTYASTGLSAATAYYYRVQATNAVGGSAWSNARMPAPEIPPVRCRLGPHRIAIPERSRPRTSIMEERASPTTI